MSRKKYKKTFLYNNNTTTTETIKKRSNVKNAPMFMRVHACVRGGLCVCMHVRVCVRVFVCMFAVFAAM